MRKNANRYAVRIFLDDRRNLHEHGRAVCALYARAEKIKEKRQEMSVRSLKVCFVDKKCYPRQNGTESCDFWRSIFFA